VSSWSSSQAVQPAPVHASQTSGGRRGSTPIPAIRQSSRRTTAHDGTAFDRPMSSASPGAGVAPKQPKPSGPSSPPVCSTGSAPPALEQACSKEHGMISRSANVVKTTGSLTSVRGVATSVSARTSTGWGCGADSQNVTRPRAAAGGRSSTPISSRNFT
jgi:hypothetical protein